eukprot:CAMPEP_0170527298 /NCGR_PEP_ID=MMETSP0209-20121228/12787_1 /TAXON_ID=665100 ORGANISM="Litonotus pictus, Strain P1" /NCGR_SAMPLE_ID=MMETSP0209 /ASSEMBLY_ACC=CAM_ASM_000301 /LENGTH=499 /DNA_ID=CAMNT_0010817747 /DNA_START=18 /DNA_END=1518 /DNA_ORIENTATION=+
MDQEYSYSVYTNDEDLFVFKWSIINDSQIRITLDVKATGWVGFGVTKHGSKTDSDLLIGLIGQDGKAAVHDMFTGNTNYPQPDAAKGGQSNISDVTGSLENGRLIVSFTRPLTSLDQYDLPIKKGELVPVMFAYKDGAPDLTQHTGRVSHRLILFPENEDDEVDPIDYSYRTDNSIMQMRVNFKDFEVPVEKEKSSWCKMYNIGEAISEATELSQDTTYHMIAYESFLNESPKKAVSQMNIFSCNPLLIQMRDDYFECDTVPYQCQSRIGFTVVGNHPVIFPEEAGLVWGSDSTKIVILQTQFQIPKEYNLNTDGKIVNNSGFNVFFTNKLRQYDIGVSKIGPEFSDISIPAGKSYYLLEDKCGKDCINSGQSEDIYAIAYGFAGNNLLKDIRFTVTNSSGTTDEETLTYMNYDLNNQVYIPTNKPYKIQRGDEIVLQCWYDSSDKTTITLGGEESNKEKCFGFLMYYPKKLDFPGAPKRAGKSAKEIPSLKELNLMKT